MQTYEGFTGDNKEVSCEIDDNNSVIAIGDNEILFILNPDFPQDAKALFEALCNIRSVIIKKDDR